MKDWKTDENSKQPFVYELSNYDDDNSVACSSFLKETGPKTSLIVMTTAGQ